MHSFVATLARIGAVAAIVLSLAVGSVMAQAPAVLPDAKLQSFVEAAMKVESLIEKWNPIILNAPSEEEARTLSNQANGELEAAITDTNGITVEEYLQIAEQARSDPELATRIRTIVAQGKP